MNARSFRFASFVLDLGRHRLSGPDGEIDLRPKSFEVLAFIVERAGRVVTKAELMQAVWPRVVVTEESLTRCISDVRRALADDRHAIVRTIPTLGYRLDVTVVPGNTERDRPPVPVSEGGRAHSNEQGGEGKRQSTALHVDVREAFERITPDDPERALALHEGLLALASNAFDRYGGSTQARPGESFVGLFGVPMAQEDHAVRACHAALAVHEAMAQWTGSAHEGRFAGVRPKIGIASGIVIFRASASSPDRAGVAMGATIDLARDLARAAEPGTTWLDESTRHLTEGQVAVSPGDSARDLPAGAACRLEARVPFATRFGAALTRGLTPFVGREDELALLRRAEGLAAGGRGQVVVVVGDAGAGKSRLVHEFAGSMRRDARWRVLACAASSCGRATSYLPVSELLRNHFGIHPTDKTDDIANTVIGKLGAGNAGLEGIIPAVLRLLDVPMPDGPWSALDPGERRRRTFDAVRQLLAAEARAQPLLVVVEDLHWVDSETQALLDALVDGTRSERLLLLVTGRPESRHGWAAKSNYSQLRLDVLDDTRTGSLLDALLGKGTDLSHLKRLLRGHGNPFFLEEAVRTLVDERLLDGAPGAYRLARPVEAVRVPPTVQAMLAARIDRQDPRPRRVLETLAVIGETVPLPLLAAIAGESAGDLQEALDQLTSAELIDEVGKPSEVEFTIRHSLIQEVASEGLLQDRRRELHARTHRAIERLYRDRIGEQTERLAYHAQRGGLHEAAVVHLRHAGTKAAALSALGDARYWLEQALDANLCLPESRATLERAVDIRMELRGVLYQMGDARALLGHLREAQSIVERLGDDRRASRVASFMTSIHTMLGQLDEAVAVGKRSLATALALDDLELRINASNYLVQAAYYRGDYAMVGTLAEDNLTRWPDDWNHRYHTGNPAPASLFNRAFLALSLAHLGRFREAALHEARAIELAGTEPSAFAVAMAHVPAPTLYPLRGEWALAKPTLVSYVAAARRGGIIGLLSNATAACAWVLAELGESREAADLVEETDRLLERQAANGIGTLAWACCSLGRACLALGRIDEAARQGERALSVASTQHGFAAYALELLGEIACRPERRDADLGEVLFRQSLAKAEPRGMRPLMARCHVGLGALERRRGRIEQADAHEAIAAGFRDAKPEAGVVPRKDGKGSA